MRLTDNDYKALEASYINHSTALAMGITRVSALEGAERMGVSGAAAGNCEGLMFFNRFPGEDAIISERLRLDHPPIDIRTGKPVNKYLSPPRQRNRAFMPLEDPAWLQNTKMEMWIGEGEKKYGALRRAATEGAALLGTNGSGVSSTLAMVMTFSGCWNWRGQVGIATDSGGHRVPAKGTIPDLDRIAWKGRRVVILYDSNCLSNPKVGASRLALARELESRGAEVYWVDLLPEPGINGPDDFLGKYGLQPFLELLKHAVRYDWRRELATTDKGKVLASFGNALTALRHAPVWNGVLGYDEFALRIEARAPTPWGATGAWKDNDDLLTVEWMERQGIKLSRNQVSDAIETVAHEHGYHPVREYLRSLTWDGIQRIDGWLTLYVGAAQNAYHSAVGERWLISAVARIFQPGCKADCVLILEGPQGIGKSTTFSILGGEYYSDDLPELGTKDAALALAGKWIPELSELDALNRAETSKTKAFVSRGTDRIRAPYARRPEDVPRQCVFAGTVNQSEYLKDETGGRRFWPVRCADKIRLDPLRRDRDQLWAEAVVAYDRGDPWWLEGVELIEEATAEQDERFQADAWEDLVSPFLASQIEVTTAQVLLGAIKKEAGHWTRADEIRVGAILRRLGWEKGPRAPKAASTTRQRLYKPKT